MQAQLSEIIIKFFFLFLLLLTPKYEIKVFEREYNDELSPSSISVFQIGDSKETLKREIEYEF